MLSINSFIYELQYKQLKSKEKNLSLNQLQYFIAVAKHLSYRRAAQILGVSQPTLTNQINSLEDHLGVKLFERSRTGTHLSAQGRLLLEEAEGVMLACARFTEAAQVLAEGENTTYRLGIPPTLGPYLLPHIFPELHKKHPGLKFYVREAAPRNLQQGLLNGDYDLILSPMTAANSQIMMEPLFTEPLKFVINSEHRLAGQELIQPKALAGEKILTLEDRHHFHHQVMQICGELNADLSRDYEGTSLDTLRQMVVMGMGSAFLPGLYIHSELHNPEALHVTELKGKPIVREHLLAWRNTSPSRTFFRQLAGEIRDLVELKLHSAVRTKGRD